MLIEQIWYGDFLVKIYMCVNAQSNNFDKYHWVICDDANIVVVGGKAATLIVTARQWARNYIDMFLCKPTVSQ